MNIVAATAASAALLVPASAQARPADVPSPVPNRTPAPVVVTAAPDAGFDWGAAGVGAGATGGLILIAAGGFAAAYRVRARVAR